MSMSNVINLNSFFIQSFLFCSQFFRLTNNNGYNIYLYLKYDEQNKNPTQFNLFSLKNTEKLEREWKLETSDQTNQWLQLQAKA